MTPEDWRDELSDEDSEQSPEEVKRAARPYSIVVGALFLIFAIVAGINALSHRTAGPGGLPNWQPLPRFAAPAASGTLDGDANINPDDADPAGHHRTPACQVAGPPQQVIRICDYFDRPLVMVAWFTRGCGTCESQLDTVEKVRKRFPGVAFLGLDIADSREGAQRRVLENGWGFPMAVDPDGAVSGLYRIGGGPMTFFAYPGGIAMETAFGELDQQELTQRIRRLLGSARRRGLFS